MRAGRRVRNIASSILVGVALLTVGVVVAGAVFSGQQLILRFLITVVVAALGFYIISDLRLQKTQVLVASPSPSSQPTNPTGSAAAMPIVQPKSDQDVVPAPPANSTAAYMARAGNISQETPTPTYASNVDATPQCTSAVDSPSTTNDETTSTSSYSAMGRIRGRNRSQPIQAKGSTGSGKPRVSAPKVAREGFELRAERENKEPISPSPSSDISVVGEAATDEAETTANASPLTALDTPTSMSAQVHRRDGADQTSILRVEDLAESSDDDMDVVADEEGKETETEENALSSEVDTSLDSSASLAEETTLPPTSSIPKASDTAVELVNIETVDAGPGSDVVDVDQLAETSTDAESTEPSDAARPLVPTKPDSGPEPTTGRRRYSAEELKQSGLAPTPIDRSEAKKRLLGSNKVVAPTGSGDQIDSAPTSPLSAINDAIFEGEQKIIKSLIDRGVLSSEGPITDEDVTTMVYVAFTSSELRKLLASGGSVDRDSESPALDDIEIYTSNDLTDADQFLVAGPEAAIDVLEEKATL